MVTLIPIPHLCFSLLCFYLPLISSPCMWTKKKKNQFGNDCKTETGGEETQRPSADRQGVMCSATIPIEPARWSIKANSTSLALNGLETAWLLAGDACLLKVHCASEPRCNHIITWAETVNEPASTRQIDCMTIRTNRNKTVFFVLAPGWDLQQWLLGWLCGSMPSSSLAIKGFHSLGVLSCI